MVIWIFYLYFYSDITAQCAVQCSSNNLANLHIGQDKVCICVLKRPWEIVAFQGKGMELLYFNKYSKNASLQLHFGCYVIRANKLCTLHFHYFEQLFSFMKQCRKKTRQASGKWPINYHKIHIRHGCLEFQCKIELVHKVYPYPSKMSTHWHNHFILLE